MLATYPNQSMTSQTRPNMTIAGIRCHPGSTINASYDFDRHHDEKTDLQHLRYAS